MIFTTFDVSPWMGDPLKVADEGVLAVVRDGSRNDVSLEMGHIRDSADMSARRDGVEFDMIRLYSEEDSLPGDHAVPGAIRLEIVGLGIRHRVGLPEGAEVSDLGPAAVVIDADDSVASSRQTVGATCPANQCVERAVQEGDIRDAADQLEAALVGLDGSLSATVVTTPFLSTLEIRAAKSPV